MKCKKMNILDRELLKAQENMKWAMSQGRSYTTTRDRYHSIAMECIREIGHIKCKKSKCECE